MKSLLATALLPLSVSAAASTASSSSTASSRANEPHDAPTRRVSQMTVGSLCPSSEEGAWFCMTNTFQRCASGEWSAVMNCAAGTICEPEGLTYASQAAFDIGNSGGTTGAAITTSSSPTSTSSSTTGKAATAASTDTSTSFTGTTSVRTSTTTTTTITTSTANGQTSTSGKTGATSSASATDSSSREKNGGSSGAIKLEIGMFWLKFATIVVGFGAVLLS